MNEPSLEAFDNCPNRTIEKRYSRLFTVCPRYPEGYEIDNGRDVFDKDPLRTRLSLQLGCAACPIKDGTPDRERSMKPLEGYHPAIVESCQSKFESGHFDDAVFTGILVVRDRLCELTGYENATDAFGRGGLVIAGSANARTDNNFQEGSKFVMLANDRFRNELAHTNDQNDLIKDPNIALQFLGMSSISMFMLESAHATTPRLLGA